MDAIKKIRIVKITGGELFHTDDYVSTEEPLEIRLVYGPLDNRLKKSISVTMRTPGDDIHLALGFLKNEGIIRNLNAVVKCAFQTFHKGELNPNILTVNLHPEINLHTYSLERNFYTTSSCGLCGKASIEAVQNMGIPHLEKKDSTISIDTLLQLPDKLRLKQETFTRTGGLHAAGLFNENGELLHLTEDVGRHNAMDKLTGWILHNEINLSNRQLILVLSGRASFELIQKAAVSGLPIVVAVGAPSSLAIDTAHAANITLAGFTRATGTNIYTHAERIAEVR